MTRHTAHFGNVWDVALTPSPLPARPANSKLWVVQHLAGYSEVTLSNGDVVRCHLHVDSFEYDEKKQVFVPQFRVIPETLVRGAKFTPRFGLTQRELS